MSNRHYNNPSSFSDDQHHCNNADISLTELWRILRDEWRWLGGGIIAGLVAASIYVASMPSQYEAVVLMSLGKVYKLSDVSVLSISPIESPAYVGERLRNHHFQSRVLRTLGWAEDKRSALFRSSLKVSSRGEMMELRLLALSPTDARHSAEAVIAEINASQSEMLGALRQSAGSNKFSSALSSEIIALESRLARLERIGKEIPRNNHADTLLWLKTVGEESRRLIDLKSLQLASEHTQATESQAFNPIQVSADPVSPKFLQTLFWGCFGGMLLGMMAVFLRRA